MKKISFVIPCYGSETTIRSVVDEIRETILLANYEYEIILINDSSPDNVWGVICELSEDSHIIGIDLAKNFGQASAIMAGYSFASGDYVLTMDDDGQSPVDFTLPIIRKISESHYDIVYGTCNDTKFNVFRRIGSQINGIMTSVMFGMPKTHHIISFYIMKRELMEEICKYSFPYTYISGLVYRTTNRIGFIEVDHRARSSGKSGYSIKKLISTWLNGFTSFSIKPLRVASLMGAFFATLGFIYAFVTIIRKMYDSSINTGWSSLICVMLLIGGMNLLVLGLTGEYIGRIYICINKAPQYVIHDIKRKEPNNEGDNIS